MLLRFQVSISVDGLVEGKSFIDNRFGFLRVGNDQPDHILEPEVDELSISRISGTLVRKLTVPQTLSECPGEGCLF